MVDEKLFYKYQRIDDSDSNHTIDNLIKNQFYFSDPTLFNDPFDCRVYYTYQGKEEDWVDLLANAGIDPTSVIKDGILNSDKVFLEKEGDLFTYTPKSTDYYDRDEPFLHGDILKKNLPRVCCFSETDDNILMWSHYTDNHQGICLRFRSYKILDGNFLFLTLNSNSKFHPFYKIEYEDDLPPIVNMFDKNRHESLVEFLKTKYSDWKYEKEYRMLLFEDELKGGTIRYEKEDLEGITFGLKMKPENVKRIYNTIDENYLKAGIEVNFYEAKEIEGKYNLNIEQINDIDSYLKNLR